MSHENTVELIGFYGGDLTHATSAWTSTNRDLTEEKIKRIPALLKTLREGSHGNPHGTPFEKSALHFLVTTDIASHIHIIKHRIAVPVNAESARYKELKEDKYYLPTDWSDVEVSNYIRQDEDFGVVAEGEKWLQVLENYTEFGNKLYHQCIKDLESHVGRKRIKESARFFKTYNSQITADVMFNFRSFVHFQSLRNAESAQVEIRMIARKMLKIVRELPGNPFEHSLHVWGLDLPELIEGV